MSWVGTSWKMNKTLAEARDYATRLAAALSDGAPAGVQPFIIPPATAITTVRDILGPDSPVVLGIQNAHWADAGAWTGEISVPLPRTPVRGWSRSVTPSGASSSPRPTRQST